MKNKPTSFLKNHADTMTIIGVNIALAAIMITLWISNLSTINAANARIDNTYNLINDMQKEIKQIYLDKYKG